MFERPEVLWLLLATPLAVAPGLMADARGAASGRCGRGGAARGPVRDTGGAARRLALADQDTGASDGSGGRDGCLAFDRTRPVSVDARANGSVARGDESARPACGARVWPQHAAAGAAGRSAPAARRPFAPWHRSRRHRYRGRPHLRAQPAAPGGRETYRAAERRQRDRWQCGSRTAGAGRAGRAVVRRGAAAIVGGSGRDRRL